MESLQKEDEMTDEAVGDPAEKPPATFASPGTAPEAEASSAPPGEGEPGVRGGSQRASFLSAVRVAGLKTSVSL